MPQDDFKILFALFAYFKQLRISCVDISVFIEHNTPLSEKFAKAFQDRFDPSGVVIDNLEDEVSRIPAEYQRLAKILLVFITKAIVRTNYFLHKPFLSFKIDLSLVPKGLVDLPKPLTFKEIFVFSEDFEGIHLRGGTISRGGIRWSNRGDFRTEILGLIKTQSIKNTIIAPVGSKGGFFIKSHSNLSPTCGEMVEFGKTCYRQFLYGCLDITDNVVDGKIKTPEKVVRYDEHDPYFVVAADKGTASFSDIANLVSKEYDFWLGDAFASGGSNGYSHKKIGITSKGAWVCVRRHFLEMGIDTQKDEFTVVGIGDMSGDVFGNGMLRSEKIKLLCAFNHMNIFLDPSPNLSESFAERERLFNLPASTWEDYDASKISKGGRIFKRSDAKCELTPEIRFCFGILEDCLSPEELIKRVLKSKFDLLWNGGIGTYVKGSDEPDSSVGDVTNDVLRINGTELGAKVVGEGGNLGFTQKGRIEYALGGGRINTDAIDNSAGVSCSDHEVNIKILLNTTLSSGKMALEERNRIILSMQDDVEHLVLVDNLAQSLALSLEMLRGPEAKTIYSDFIGELETVIGLDRIAEGLPEESEINARYENEQKLTRPELAILLAYSKIETYKALLCSNVLKDSYFLESLFDYFPHYMKEHFSDEIHSHQLKNEIVCTMLGNRLVNYAGITFTFEVQKKTGRSFIDIIQAYFVAEKILGIINIFEDIKSKYEANTGLQYKILLMIRSKILMPVVIRILNNTKEIASVEAMSDLLKKQIGSLKISKQTLEIV